MRLLLDSHFLLWMGDARLRAVPDKFVPILADTQNVLNMSGASWWELKLKHDVGKLTLTESLSDMVGVLERGGVRHLPVTHEHALAALQQPVATKDPFDRLMLAQCQVEDLRLVTVDRALQDHPLTFQV